MFRAAWQEGAAERLESRNLKDLISATPGIVQVVEVYLTRPAAAVPW